MNYLSYVFRLENILKEYLKTPNIILTNRGRIALLLGLKLFCKPKSVIAVQAGVCRAVPWAIVAAGMQYVEFIDNVPKADAIILWKPQQIKTKLPLIIDIAKYKLDIPKNYLFGIMSFGKGKLIEGCGGGVLFSKNPLPIELAASSKTLIGSVYEFYSDKPILKTINKIDWFARFRNNAPNYPAETISEFDATIAYRVLLEKFPRTW
jgi:hypothetical protein